MGLLNKTVYLGRIIASRVLNKCVPLQVYFNIVDTCNLQCRYCWVKYYKRGHKELPKEHVFLIVDELAGLGTKRLILAGGEFNL